MKRNVGLAALVSATLLGLGFIVGLILASPPAIPPSLTSNESSAGYFTPVKQNLDDARDVQLSLELDQSMKLFSTANGIVTHNDCRPGAILTSWASTLSVDGNPLLNLSTSTPFWRDIVPGDSGADVLGIQEELVRQGLQVAVDGVAGPRTISQINTRLKELGAQVSNPRSISQSNLLWLPSSRIQAKSCAIPRGASLAESDEILTTQPNVNSLAVTNLPKGLIPGDRVLEIDGKQYAVDELGRALEGVDLSPLAALAAAPSTTEPEGKPTGLSSEHKAQLLLTTPVDAWAVPPSSIVIDSDTKACVTDAAGRTVAVHIVSSQLGKSFILFLNENQPPNSIALHPKQAHC